jgi:hypothetical protein
MKRLLLTIVLVTMYLWVFLMPWVLGYYTMIQYWWENDGSFILALIAWGLATTLVDGVGCVLLGVVATALERKS